jgi:hypothetical protein
MKRIVIVAAASLLLVACQQGGTPNVSTNDAATAAARVTGGLQGQVDQVSAAATAQAAGAAAGTPAAGAVRTAIAVAPAGAVATVQSVAGAIATPEQAQAMAKDAVSKALGVPVDQVTVSKVEQVQWSDSSLGCREQGKAYSQVITPGFRVVVMASGKQQEVHTDTSGRAVVCQSPTQ